MKYYRTKR